ncbi:MAG: hypothetical protein LBG69_09545 [Zoogloeaceae bacterium]|nr:hypothetical protein [Zoogloeaceae bacterium]
MWHSPLFVFRNGHNEYRKERPVDLQASLEVAEAGGTFDAPLIFALVLMIAAGVLGGLVNAYLAERQSGERQDRRRFALFGVVTAFTAPLFLNMLSSGLLDAARVRPGGFFVFAAFCLLYVIAARRLFENPSARGQEELEQAKDEIWKELDALRHAQNELSARLSPPPRENTAAESGQNAREALNYNDVSLLKAIADESYMFGNLAALAEKTLLGRELISQRLTVLKGMGLIEARINDKNMLHWVISGRGQQMLAEILAQQEEPR